MTIASTNVKLVPSQLLFKAPNSLLTEMDMVRKGFDNEPLKDFTMERKRVEEFEESLRYKLWMSFSLEVFSQNSL